MREGVLNVQDGEQRRDRERVRERLVHPGRGDCRNPAARIHLDNVGEEALGNFFPVRRVLPRANRPHGVELAADVVGNGRALSVGDRVVAHDVGAVVVELPVPHEAEVSRSGPRREQEKWFEGHGDNIAVFIDCLNNPAPSEAKLSAFSTKNESERPKLVGVSHFSVTKLHRFARSPEIVISCFCHNIQTAEFAHQTHEGIQRRRIKDNLGLQRRAGSARHAHVLLFASPSLRRLLRRAKKVRGALNGLVQ